MLTWAVVAAREGVADVAMTSAIVATAPAVLAKCLLA